MRSYITISAVVFAHVAVLSLIGCRSTSGFHEDHGKTAGAKPATPAGIAPATQTVVTDAPPAVSNGPIASQDNDVTAVKTDDDNVKTPAEKPVAPVTGKAHVVKKGESLGLIAKREGISVKSLAAANQLKANAQLKEGQKIIIPEKPAASKTASVEGGTVYVVKKGDTLGGIALANKTTVAKIQAANNMTGANIREGQKLLLPKTTATAAAGKTPETAAAPKTTVANGPAKAPATPEKTQTGGEMDAGGFGGFGIGNTQPAHPVIAPAQSAPAPATETVPADAVPTTTVNH